MQEEPYIIEKKRKSPKYKTVRRIYAGRLIAAIVIICLLVIGGVLWFSYSDGKLFVAAREYRYVSMGKYGDISAASKRADDVIKSGGAGYLYGKSEYKVMAACYADKSDADEVCARLVSAGETAEVFTASRPAISAEKPKSKAIAALLKEMLPKPDELFDELYAVSVKADTKEISEAAALYAVLKMSVTAAGYAEKCSEREEKACVYLSKLLGEISESLDKLARTEKNVAQSVKYTLCEIADIICARSEEFANKSKNLS